MAARIPLKIIGGALSEFAPTDAVSADGIEPRSGTTLTLGDGTTTDVRAGYPTVGDATTTTPTPPAAGSTLFSLFRAGRRMASQVGASERDYAFQPSLFTQKISLWSAQGNGATVSAIGFGVSNTGTATTRNVAVTNFSTMLRRLAFVSAATAGASCGTRHGLLQFYRGDAAGRGGFFYVARFVIDTVLANMRWFVGLSGTAAALASANPSTLLNLFGFSIDSGQTTVRFINNDGAGTATVADLGASFPATTAGVVYEIRLYCPPNGATIYYSIERLDTAAFVEGSVAADIPANTTLLAPQIWMNNGAAGAAAVAIAVETQYIETPE